MPVGGAQIRGYIHGLAGHQCRRGNLWAVLSGPRSQSTRDDRTFNGAREDVLQTFQSERVRFRQRRQR